MPVELTFSLDRSIVLFLPYPLSSMNALRLNAETFPSTPAETKEFSAAGVNISAAESIDDPSARSLLPTVDALLVVSAKVRREAIDQLDRCRVIVRYGSGTDNVDVKRATERGIVVANVPNFCLSEVADHTMALLLASARKLILMDRYTRSGHWQARGQENVRRIAGKTLGLIGFGSIAQEVARRAMAFDLKVVAYDPHFDRARARSLGVAEVGLDALLDGADFVSLHVPLTDKTSHMIGENELRRMKPEAFLINTARGGLVDETALIRALTEGWISGAGIDVYEKLPMFEARPAYIRHPLFDLENVVLTPHSAGTSIESLHQLKLDGAREAIMVLNGRTPQHWVNPDVNPRFHLQENEATQ
jgi:D-3-phosphoglycerate dehydrogenase / 2-oxoglutarate reductase